MLIKEITMCSDIILCTLIIENEVNIDGNSYLNENTIS